MLRSVVPAAPSAGTALGLLRLCWAVALLAAPERVLGLLHGPVESALVATARALGARHAVQATAEIASWPRWRRAGALVDAAHSLTAAALGVGAPRLRELACADSALAAAFAAGGLRASPHAGGLP